MSGYFDITSYDLTAAAEAKGIPVVGSQVNPRLIWVDLESTGLSAETDIVLEVGCLMTNEYGELISGSAFHAYVDHDIEADHLRGVVDDLVRDMHEKSGLWDDLEEADERGDSIPAVDLSDAMLEYFDSYDLPLGKFKMCGSSVGMDQRFLSKLAPKVVNFNGSPAFFHYRIIDNSTVKSLAEELNSAVVETLPTKDEKHRVMPDLLDTISEYRHYVSEFLFTERDADAASSAPVQR